MLKQVLPSITNEVLKQVVAEFDAGELITMREQVLLLTNQTAHLDLEELLPQHQQ